jgi:phosphate transport system substrate-binding protein
MTLRACPLLLMLVACAARAVSIDPALPRYAPQPVAVPKSAGYITRDGRVSVVGYNDMQGLLTRLDALFERAHPGVKFVLTLKGTRTAPPALARNESVFAPMGAEFSAEELAAYRAASDTEPVPFRIAHGSLDPRALSGPIGIFVHRDNPLAALTAGQVARVFTAGAPLTWGELGAVGDWAARPVHPCGLAPSTALGLFMRNHHFSGRVFAPGFAEFLQSREVVAHTGLDRMAIGFAAANRLTPDVKLLAIAPDTETAPVSCTAENLIAGRYAYDRYLLIYARRSPDGELDPLTNEYLRLALSLEGQQAIADDPLGYLPLSAADAASERAKLN